MSSKMKSWISYALALVLISASTKPSFAEDASRQTGVNTSQSTSHFKKHITLTVDLDYLIYQPKEAVKASNKKFPTILFLHGSGERGTNVWDVTKHGPPHLVKEGKDFPFIVISPQCAPGEQWQTESLFAFIQEIKKRYPIDPDRLYLTGLSMGGSGAWNLALKHPTLFAAVVPICGRADNSVLPFIPADRMQNIKHLPIWVFHGAKDPETPVKRSIDMVNSLKELGANVNILVYPNALHDSWTQTYSNPELYTWLLSHNRKFNGFSGKFE